MSNPDNFLGIHEPSSLYEKAHAVIYPIPYEATVSYGKGTSHGPAAIISASQQVELYDREYDAEPALVYGIHTLAPSNLPGNPEKALSVISEEVAHHTRKGKLVVGLGGEHTISLGFARGLLEAVGGPLTIVQIDAHCDLRDTYENSHLSHACVIRRLVEEPGVEHVLQLGIRSLCNEEMVFIRENPDKVRVWFPEDILASNWQKELAELTRNRRIFLTIDVDGIDPSIIPATGTPEPDGLTWQDTMEILKITGNSGQIIGLDCVELAPIPGLHMAEFSAAKLVYKAISYALRYPKGAQI